LPRSDFVITSIPSGSPFIIALAIAVACSKVMCGGSGAMSGSTTTSIGVGRSAATA